MFCFLLVIFKESVIGNKTTEKINPQVGLANNANMHITVFLQTLMNAAQTTETASKVVITPWVATAVPVHQVTH